MAKTITLTTPGAKALYSKSNLDTNFSGLNNHFLNFLHLGGTGESSNTMLADLDMGGFEIISSVTPTAPNSLATRAYVDQKVVIASTVGTIGSLVVDADGDTKVDTESAADDDILRIMGATSGGAADAIQVVGTSGSAASVTNPLIQIKKYVDFDANIRLRDSVGTTFIEMAAAIDIQCVGNVVMNLSSTAILASQHIEMAIDKRVGDLDNDTYIVFNETSDDDTVRIYAGGVEKATFTAGSVSISVDSVSGNFAIGGATIPTGATKALHMVTGTSATTASDLDDNQVSIYSTVVSGIENKLNFDFKLAGPLRSTVVLGNDCVFPNDVSVSNDLIVTGDISTATMSGTIGGTPTINTAWIFSGVPVFSGNPSFTGAPTLTNYTNAGHTHATTATGGTIGFSDITGTVTESQIAANAINLAALKDADEDDSKTAGAPALFILSAGQFAFWPTQKQNDTSSTNRMVSPMQPHQAKNTYISQLFAGVTAYTSYVMLGIASGTVFSRFRYITASPPYDLGSGDIPVFIWVGLDSSGKIDRVSIAKDPPWAFNGPTDIVPKFMRGSKAYKYEYTFSDRPSNPIELLEWYKTKPKSQRLEVEITQELKQRDMPLIPHPFCHDTSVETTVLLDPLSSICLELSELRDMGEDINTLFHEDYLRISNTFVDTSAPPGVLIPKFDWKKT